MITEVTQSTAAQFTARLGQTPFFAAAMGVTQATTQGRHKLAQFYLVGSTAALQLVGQNALLCGHVDDAEEMNSFLQFCGVARIKTDGFAPDGFAEEELLMMQYSGAEESLPLPQGMVLDTCPRMIPLSITPCLGDGTGVRADDFASDACARRNRAMAEIWALTQNGQYVSTAGIYAITPWEAYLAAVATHQDYQRRGAAGYLVQNLAKKYASRPVRLLCAANNVPFYTRCGFTPVGKVRQFVRVAL